MREHIRKMTSEGEWTIIYEAQSGIISKRTIYVHKFEGKKMIAYCYLRKQIRCFHIERILAAELKIQKRKVRSSHCSK